MPVIPGAEAFTHTGASDIGVLLCHGFTGSPASMRPWGAHLAGAGFTVHAPRLPGHGTTWQELNRTTWQDWYDCARTELRTLLDSHSTVFVFGHSMGGSLALRVAQEFGSDIAGIGLVNPAISVSRRHSVLLPLAHRFVPSVAGLGGDIAKPGTKTLSYPRVPLRAAASLTRLWKLIRADLGKITQPLLVCHSLVDHVVDPANSRIITAGVGSADVTVVELPNSFHVATLDYDAQLIFDRSEDFVRRVHSTRLSAV